MLSTQVLSSPATQAQPEFIYCLLLVLASKDSLLAAALNASWSTLSQVPAPVRSSKGVLSEGCLWSCGWQQHISCQLCSRQHIRHMARQQPTWQDRQGASGSLLYSIWAPNHSTDLSTTCWYSSCYECTEFSLSKTLHQSIFISQHLPEPWGVFA